MNRRFTALTLATGVLYFWGRRLFRRRNHRVPNPHALVIQPEIPATVTRCPNNDLHIRWQPPAGQVTIYTAPHPDEMPAKPLATVTQENHYVATGLDPDRRYYFKLVFDDGTRFITAERILPLEGGLNLRDAGGYPTAAGRQVRWGQLYRSGDLSRMTDADLRYLETLGIRFICDLRTSQELTKTPNRLPPHASLNYLHHPIYERSGKRSSGYWLKTLLFKGRRLEDFWQNDVYIKRFVVGRAEAYGSVLRHVADAANRPAIIHCTAGKDRTGIAFALLLSLLGVPEETIVADYTISNLYYDALYEAIKDDAQRLALFGIQTPDLFPLLTAQAKIIATTLAYIRDHYGSVEAYLRTAAGLEEQTLSVLREALIT